MVYLKRLNLLDEFHEHLICQNTTYERLDNSVYPLHIFPLKNFSSMNFSEITLIYGGNGSGKTTLLNIISNKLNAKRKSSFDQGLYFDMYVRNCNIALSHEKPLEIKMITSDDVFDALLDIRAINQRVNRRKDELAHGYINNKYSRNEVSIEDYETLKEISDARTKTKTAFVRSRLANGNIKEFSNGESALLFWEREIKENSIYILDEPENSLSAENQIKLKQFIEDSSRFYNCQFIISTHSPFLLSLIGATIYDLDSNSDYPKPWTELSNVRLYYDFFKERENEFLDK